MREERFECVPRRRHVRLAECFVDHRIGAAPACVGCVVGAQHAQLAPARAWPSGALVQWIGNAPPEVVGETPERRQGSKRYALHVLAPNVIAEARPERHLRLVHDIDRDIELAIVGPNPREQDMAREAKRHTYSGKSLTLEEWTREPECAEGLTEGGLKERLRQGRTIAEALTTPKGAKHSRRLTKANGEADELDQVVGKHTRPKRAKATVAPKSNGTHVTNYVSTAALTVTAAPSAAAELLRSVGYEVRESRALGRLVLVVEEPLT